MQIFKKQTKKIIWQSNLDNIFIHFIYWNIFINTNPANIHLFKVNNRNTRKRSVLVLLLLTLNIFHTFF